MTLEIVNHEGQLAIRNQGTLPTQSDAVTAAVHAWVSGLDVAMQGADYIVDTPACPDSFWPLPGDTKLWNIPGKNPKLRLPNEDQESFLIRRRIAAQTVGFVVRYGLGLGLAPEVALNGIFVIGGRPSMYAEQMVALVKSQGHGHRVIERTAERCTVEVCHRGESEWQQFTFTMDDAIQAGYVKSQGPNAGKNEWGKDKTGGNEKYTTNPKTMLYARASSIACKTVFPDVLRGMVTYEEIQDERSREPQEEAPIRATAAPTTAAAIRARVGPAAEVVAEDKRAAEFFRRRGTEEPAATPPGSGLLRPPAEVAAEDARADAADAATAKPVTAPDPEPLNPRTWDQINRRFVELEVTGDGQTARRLAVIRHILGRRIARGSEMTAEEGRTVLDNLSAHVVYLVTGFRPETEAAPAAQPAASTEADDEYDPTTEPGWGQHLDGADAGGEACAVASRLCEVVEGDDELDLGPLAPKTDDSGGEA